tara:strand:- start:4731 stop:5567 length:837 start_codon:yes stop_codon:yes gene_type:complete
LEDPRIQLWPCSHSFFWGPKFDVLWYAVSTGSCESSEQVRAEEGKPDLVVQLPGDRVILADSKVPDLNFLSTLDEADDVKRKDAMAAHAAKMKSTIKALADRDYPSQFPNSLGYVVFFLPAESLFSAALEGDRALIVWAAPKRILLATPASLIALLRSVAVSWQQHEQTIYARRIAEMAKDLFSRVATFTKHFDNIRAGLDRATKAYNEAVGSYERSVRPSGERLLKLGVPNAGKEWVQGKLLEESCGPFRERRNSSKTFVTGTARRISIGIWLGNGY